MGHKLFDAIGWVKKYHEISTISTYNLLGDIMLIAPMIDMSETIESIADGTATSSMEVDRDPGSELIAKRFLHYGIKVDPSVIFAMAMLVTNPAMGVIMVGVVRISMAIGKLETLSLEEFITMCPKYPTVEGFTELWMAQKDPEGESEGTVDFLDKFSI